MTKAELRNAIDEAKTIEEVEALEKEIENVTDEVVAEEVAEETPAEEVVEETKAEVEEEITHEEERGLLRDVITSKKINLRKMEGLEMEEKNYDFKKEYRSAWAKKCMGLAESKFTENEKRALGDAVTTTATTFVEADESTQGINNGGLFIPESVREEFMERLEETSPIFRDVRKLAVNGNIDLPYLFEADDAEWYAELSDTKNEGIEFKSMQLTGFELAKDIVVTWKLEEMAVDSFINFILDELTAKMGKALINAVIYGDGNGKPTGITHGLTPVTTGDTPVDRILNTYKALSSEAKIGAKVYVSSDLDLAVVAYKDQNGNYPFLNGVGAVKGIAIEVDPYLKDEDIVAGNAKNYILNENTSIRVDREKTIKGRKTIYGAYAIYDGKAKPASFAYGTTPASV